MWRSEHNYFEKELNLSSIVICYNILHCSHKAAPALVLECYEIFCLFFRKNNGKRKGRKSEGCLESKHQCMEIESELLVPLGHLLNCNDMNSSYAT
jgi:hypothetical protein